MRRKNNITMIIIVVILAALMVGLLMYAGRSERELALNLSDSSENSTSGEDYTINVFADNNEKFEEENILITPDEFQNDSDIINYNGNKNASVILKKENSMLKTDMLLLYFVAYTEDVSAKIQIKVGDYFEAEYPVTTDKTEYYIPITDNIELNNIRINIITDVCELNIGDMYLVNYGEKDVTKLKTGMFNAEDYEEVQLDYDDGLGTDGGAVAAISDNEYLYCVKDGVLSVYDLNNDDKLVGQLSDLGITRDLEFCDGGDTLLITSRVNGVYFVDISDVGNMSVVSHYDTLGMASGVEVCGNYAFICSRYFGTEIIDISDTSNPVYVSGISTAEAQINCTVSGDYLYVGCWDQKDIQIYDISNINKPEHIATIEADGNVDGVYADDNCLYVATGYHSANNEYSSLSDCGYGMGNGMEIYDIKDPAEPYLVSAVKIDGRYYSLTTGIDTWKVYVSDEIAYLTNTVNGVFVYNVSNPYAPKRIAHYSADISETEQGGDAERADYDKSKYLFPYKSKAYYNDAIADIALTDGAFYICGNSNDIYKIEADYAVNNNAVKTGEFSQEAAEAEEITAKGYNTEVYACDTLVYAAQVYENHIFAACGSGGIHILDEELNVIDIVETEGDVKDIKIYDNYIYTAQGTEGVVIYQISDTELEEMGTFNIENYFNRSCSSLELTADGKYLVVQFGYTIVKVVNVSDVTSPKEVTDISVDTVGNMYYRNICTGLVSDKYVGIYGSNSIQWFTSDSAGNIKKVDITENPFYAEEQGMTSYGGYVIAMCEGGYVYYDPSIENDDLSVTYISDTRIRGKVTAKDDMMVVSNAKEKTVYIVNIENIDSPFLTCQFSIEGNPDIATITDNYILIPAKHSGLIKLSKE